MRAPIAAVAALWTLAGGFALAGQPTVAAQLQGRPLVDVLGDFQRQGLRIVFSSELVRPEMRVVSEPKSKDARKRLNEVLKPHGLEIRAGPRSSLLVVKSRESKRPTGGAPPPGSVRGTVIDARTGTPLPGVLVALQGHERETLTDRDGTFALTGVPAERQHLLVSLVGYALARPSVDIRSDAVSELTIRLADGTGAYTENVTVTADRFRGPMSVVPSQQALTSADMLELRGVLTDDPFRALQALPGAATGNDFASEFSARGSTSRHIGMSIDGMTTRWPVHAVRQRESTGSVALINGDVVDSVTFAPGAYAQTQPGRLGPWLDFAIREGSRAAPAVHGAVSVASASLVLEGPLGPSKRGSWLLSVRQSYLQWVLKRLDDEGATDAFGFTDAQSRIVFDVAPKHRVELTAVAGRSRLDNAEQAPDADSITVGSARAGFLSAGWRATLDDRLVLSQRLAVTGYGFHNDGVAGILLADGVASEVAYRGDLAWTVRRSVLVDAGVYVQRQRESETLIRFLDDARGTGRLRRTEIVDASAWTPSAFGRFVWTSPGGAGIDGGVRVSRSTLVERTTTSPWLSGAVPICRTLILRAGGGLYQQFPDVSQAAGSFGGGDVRYEKATHAELGIEWRPTSSLRAQLALYDRQERDGLRLEDSEPRLADGRVEFASVVPYWRNALDGSARGVEFLVQRRAPAGLIGWIGYAYGRTRYTDVERHERFWGDYDQRHTLNAYAHYRLSSKTAVSGKLRVGSNFPVPGYLKRAGDRLAVGTVRNTYRLPTYARLDVRTNHTFLYSRRRLTLFVEVLNLLNRTNYRAANSAVLPDGTVLGATAKLFPLVPSAGLMIDF